MQSELKPITKESASDKLAEAMDAAIKRLETIQETHAEICLGDDLAHYRTALALYRRIPSFAQREAAWNTRLATSNELPADVLDEVRDALHELLHAVCDETGFAQAVRNDSGMAYPWEPLDFAEAKARAALAKLSAMPSGWLPMIAFAESLPERDDLRGEQVFLTFSDKTGTWNVETIEAGWDDDMTGLPLGNSHWLDITEMWPRSAHPTPPEGEK